MLCYLRIRNFALVEDLEVTFGPGFNVITGETGAGKSLMIGALNLLLGERAEKQAIRTGTREAVVEALLRVPRDDGGIDAILADAGLDACEDRRLVLRRVISRDGTGRNIVNGGTTTLAVFKRLGERLVDLHGPHEHQSLFHEGPRTAMLDAYGGTDRDREAYAAAYQALNALKAERARIVGSDDAVIARMELLAFQTQELEAAELDAGEESALAAELDAVANAQRIRELTGALDQVLVGDDVSAFRALCEAQRLSADLERIQPAMAEYGAEIRALATQVQALAENLAADVRDVDDDPERLLWLENRTALYFKLKRKYNATVPELLTNLAAWQEQLAQWRNRDALLQDIEARIRAAADRLTALGETLGQRRRKAATQMARAVTQQLADLGLAQGAFNVNVTDAPPRSSGADQVDYAFTPNLGEPTASLQTIASSGEISRVMLAVKAVLANHDRIPILVFDEIDANLGGETGHAVGAKLAALAEHHQVICITHLAPVAACAATHFAVAKQVDDGRTRTLVQALDSIEQRAVELARMLGGRQTGDAALRHAESLLQQAATTPRPSASPGTRRRKPPA